MTTGDIEFITRHMIAGFAGLMLAGTSTGAALTLDLTGILAVAWEWLSLLALAFWIGLLATEGIVLDRLERASTLLARARRRARPLRWLSLAALFAGDIVALILRAAQGVQSPGAAAVLHLIVATTFGVFWLARLGLLIISVGLLLGMRQHAPRLLAPALLILSALLLLARVLSSDTIEPGQLSISGIALAWLVMAALLVWTGSILYLAYVLWPLLPVVEPDRSVETLLALLRRVQPLLLGSACVLLVSDTYLSESFPGSIQQFAASAYGRILLAQWLLIALMLALGGIALFVLRPRLVRQAALLPVVNADLPARRARQQAQSRTARQARGAFILAAWISVGALLCAALLAFVSPANPLPGQGTAAPPGAVATPSPTAGTGLTQVKQAGNLSIKLTITPGRLGTANALQVTLLDRLTGQPAGRAQITATITMEVMNMGTTRVVLSGGPPVYHATIAPGKAFSMYGLWDIALIIRQPSRASLQTTFTVLLNA